MKRLRVGKRENELINGRYFPLFYIVITLLLAISIGVLIGYTNNSTLGIFSSIGLWGTFMLFWLAFEMYSKNGQREEISQSASYFLANGSFREANEFEKEMAGILERINLYKEGKVKLVISFKEFNPDILANLLNVFEEVYNVIYGLISDGAIELFENAMSVSAKENDVSVSKNISNTFKATTKNEGVRAIFLKSIEEYKVRFENSGIVIYNICYEDELTITFGPSEFSSIVRPMNNSTIALMLFARNYQFGINSNKMSTYFDQVENDIPAMKSYIKAGGQFDLQMKTFVENGALDYLQSVKETLNGYQEYLQNEIEDNYKELLEFYVNKWYSYTNGRNDIFKRVWFKGFEIINGKRR